MKTKFTYILVCCFLFISSLSNAQSSIIIETANTSYTTDSIGWYAYDSTYYFYSGVRGGFPVIQNGYWEYVGKFDTVYYAYRSDRAGMYSTTYRTVETFDTHDNLLSSTSQTYDTATGTWKSYYQTVYTYDAHNNTLSTTYQNWDTSSGGSWKNAARYSYSYDASNNMLTDTTLIPSGSAWNFSSLYLYTYNSHNDLVENIDMSYVGGSWANSEKYTYYINAGHKPDSMLVYMPSGPAWSNFYKDIYTYDGSYNMLTDTMLQWNNITFVWHNIYLHVYTYSGSDRLSDEYKTAQGDTAWVGFRYTSYNYDANHNETLALYQNWDTATKTYINYYKYDNSFNSLKKLDTLVYSTWASGAWATSYKTKYYYKTLDGVKDIAQNGGDMHLYPSPANGYMNVDIKWKTAQAAKLAIYDMNGRLCRQWAADASLNYHCNIPTTNLPAGNYILKVQGDAGQAAQQFSVVH